MISDPIPFLANVIAVAHSIRSIEAMFQFGGGIESPEVEKVIATLQKQKFLSIDPDGRVTYIKG